ncbi:MAG: hypothetical protein ACE5GQ_03655 [Nitrospinales bacterium]
MSFSWATFSGEGKVNFNQAEVDKNSWMDFSSVTVKNPRKIRFENVYLGRTSFYQTDIEEFTFKNVKFAKTKDRFINRERLADETWNDLVPKEKRRTYDKNFYSHVEILYRQLKRNFEEQRDYARAGDFHYGEMEMRRKRETLENGKRFTKIPSLKYFSLISLYKLFSGYGEKWYQALISLLALLALFASLNILWIEPQTKDVNVEPKEKIIWRWYASPPWEKFGNSLLYTFKIMTLQRDFDFKPIKGVWLGRAMVSAQFLIGPTIIALMILAIRRQFRR